MSTVSEDFKNWVDTNSFGLNQPKTPDGRNGWEPTHLNHRVMKQFICGILYDFDFVYFQRWIHDMLTQHSLCPFYTPMCINTIVQKINHIIKQFENSGDEDNLKILVPHLIFLVDNIIY
jgi:hypothetical protein